MPKSTDNTQPTTFSTLQNFSDGVQGCVVGQGKKKGRHEIPERTMTNNEDDGCSGYLVAQTEEQTP